MALQYYSSVTQYTVLSTVTVPKCQGGSGSAVAYSSISTYICYFATELSNWILELYTEDCILDCVLYWLCQLDHLHVLSMLSRLQWSDRQCYNDAVPAWQYVYSSVHSPQYYSSSIQSSYAGVLELYCTEDCNWTEHCTTCHGWHSGSSSGLVMVTVLSMLERRCHSWMSVIL